MREISFVLSQLLSFGYRTYRNHVISAARSRCLKEGKKFDLENVVLLGDEQLKKLPGFLTRFKIPEGIGVKVYDLDFPSPLVLSSFKDDYGVIQRWTELGLGGATVKTIMPTQRDGNPRPRLTSVQYEGKEHFLNAMGLPGPGLDETFNKLKNSHLFSLFGTVIGLSIGGTTLDEYKCVFNKLELLHEIRENVVGIPVIGTFSKDFYYEINISCPNTSEGQQMSKNPALLDELLSYMRTGEHRTNSVIFVKVSPDSDNETLLRLGRITRKYERTGINAGNTTTRTCEQVGLPNDEISIGKGGLSGPALYKRTKEMLELLAPLRLPIISTGGIYCAEQVMELQRIARRYNVPHLVGMASAVVKDMYCIPKINNELARNLIQGFVV